MLRRRSTFRCASVRQGKGARSLGRCFGAVCEEVSFPGKTGKEFKNGGAKSAIDEYFEKFRAVGLKVGVCIRPQDITMIDGKPVHQATDDEHAVQILREKIAYAKERWGCTLFYVDSSATAGRPFYPEVFKTIAQAHPDVLLIPENESMRYFAYSAPLNSYVHQARWRAIGLPKRV